MGLTDDWVVGSQVAGCAGTAEQSALHIYSFDNSFRTSDIDADGVREADQASYHDGLGTVGSGSS